MGCNQSVKLATQIPSEREYDEKVVGFQDKDLKPRLNTPRTPSEGTTSYSTMESDTDSVKVSFWNTARESNELTRSRSLLYGDKITVRMRTDSETLYEYVRALTLTHPLSPEKST